MAEVRRGADLPESMFAVVKHFSALQEPAALRGWFKQIAVRTALAAARGMRHLPVDPHKVMRRVAVTDGTVLVREVLAGFTPEHRAVLRPGDLADTPESEIAGLLGVPAGTVRSRRHRARQAFRSRCST
jgi:DNA-directed RNA polymerase specialized sigma24 family protein